jgi:hypothetical protein
MDGDALRVTMLGAVLSPGDVVVIESGRLQPFPLHHVAFLDDQGMLASTLSSAVPETAFRLVHHKTKAKLEIVAQIATLDADADLAVLNQRARAVAQRWQQALAKVFRDAALADAADTVALDPDVERERRVATLRLFSRALNRRMSAEARDRWPAMSGATSAPVSARWPDLNLWLDSWVTLMSDDALIAEVLNPTGWRAPNSVRAGRNATGVREARFEFQDAWAEEVEILSPNGFANSRWRFGESGQEQPFPNAKRTAEGWSARLKTSGSQLYVWTDLESPETLLMRPITHAAGASK